MSNRLKKLNKVTSIFGDPCAEEAFDIRGVKVLKQHEWTRLQKSLIRRETEAKKILDEKEKKEKIRECSQSLVKNWTNTVMKGSGARAKKLAERKKRLEEEEAHRNEVDAAEAQYQAEKRREFIEDAKTKQYYQTDRVKNLHSALFYSEVIKEREVQIEYKQLKELSECDKDNIFVIKARREYEEALKADQDREAERFRKTKENEEFIRSQIKYNEDVRSKEAAEWLLDGENIRKIAADHAIEQKKLDQLELEAQRERMEDNLRQINDVKLMRRIDKLKDEEDDENIRIFAAAKKKVMKLRVEREEELAREKSDNLERMKEQLVAQMKLKMDDEDHRIKNAVVEKEMKYQLEETDKDQKRKDMQRSIDEHRFETLRRIEFEKKNEKDRDIQDFKAMRDSDAILNEFETKRRAIRREDFIKLAEENLQIAKEIKERDWYNRDNQMKLEQENQQLLELEEKVFQDYAKRIIDHCEDGKRNTHPLHMAAKRAPGGLPPIKSTGQTSSDKKPSHVC